ncbi:uncharacterized protein L201_005315 [Kwoniella dendrophila CBS 6074]|uniref:F-box domain-containing protein n=1 Tax=Kwoniella dendrophila CBS 6074 TaxID=1295534 RepID=A0AAX4JYP7_9TREE
MKGLNKFLVELIFHNLPLSDLLSCSATCKKYNKIITCSTKIQLFLYKQLLGHTYISTTNHLELISDKHLSSTHTGKNGRNASEELSRLLGTEDNLLRFKPHLKSCKLPEDQHICAINENCIITRSKFCENLKVDEDDLYTLITIWTYEDVNDNPSQKGGERSLRAQPLKVDFKPAINDWNSLVVDIQDNIVICVEEYAAENEVHGRNRIRILDLFNQDQNNNGRMKFHEADNIVKQHSILAMGALPQVQLGRGGLLLVQIKQQLRWLRWNQGKYAKWNLLDIPSYKGRYDIPHAQIYGSETLVILCQSILNEFNSYNLLVYKLQDRNEDVHKEWLPETILMLPKSAKEWRQVVNNQSYSDFNELGRNLENPNLCRFPLKNSNNGRSSVIGIVYTILDLEESFNLPPHLQHVYNTKTTHLVIDIPLQNLKNLTRAQNPPDKQKEKSARQGQKPIESKEKRTNPKRACQIHSASTLSSSISDAVADRNSTKDIDPEDKDIPSYVRGVEVLSLEKWEKLSVTTYNIRLDKKWNTFPDTFGTRSFQYYRHLHEEDRIEGNVLTELFSRNYLSNTHNYEIGKYHTVGGMKQLLKLKKSVVKDTRVLRKQITCKRFDQEGNFNGEQLVFEHENGWVTILDFAG